MFRKIKRRKIRADNMKGKKLLYSAKNKMKNGKKGGGRKRR